MAVVLKQVRDHLVPFQWHNTVPWKDERTRKPEAYLAGLPTREAAEQYGRAKGWM